MMVAGMDVNDDADEVLVDELEEEAHRMGLVGLNEARQEEPKNIDKLGMYEHVPIEQCLASAGKPPNGARCVGIL